MEKEGLRMAMKDSISEVLEKMFFLPLEFSDTLTFGELGESERHNIVAARLDFRGPFAGHFFLYIPQGLAQSLTASFMGRDEEIVLNDHVTETTKEILNIIAGNTFSCVNHKAVFNLDIPKLVSVDKVMGGDANQEEEIFIPIDTLKGRLAVKMVYRLASSVS